MPTVGDIVRDALAELGAEASIVERVWFRWAEAPELQDLVRGCDPDQLGAFWGAARELGRPGGGPLPDCRPAEGEIVVFWRNVRPLTAANVGKVIRHEIAHALGWEEDEIEAMGLGALEGACCS